MSRPVILFKLQIDWGYGFFGCLTPEKFGFEIFSAWTNFLIEWECSFKRIINFTKYGFFLSNVFNIWFWAAFWEKSYNRSSFKSFRQNASEGRKLIDHHWSNWKTIIATFVFFTTRNIISAILKNVSRELPIFHNTKFQNLCYESYKIFIYLLTPTLVGSDMSYAGGWS